MTHSDEVHAFKPAEAWEVDSESADSDPDEEPGLNVRLLKERLEMEVGMRREGLRALAFAMLCLCFAMAFFESSQPPDKSASRWFISEELGMEQMRQKTTRRSLFDSVMTVSSNLRGLSPLSSVYVGDPMAKVLIGSEMEFPAGPIQLPASRHPTLQLEWTLTARVTNYKPTGLVTDKKLIARSFPSGDSSGLSCWAWYTWNYNIFSLEYGRNNLDDMYPIATFTFDSSQITTDPTASNLVAIKSNATHVSVRLQDAGEIIQVIVPGTVVADCAGETVVEVGDDNLSISNLIYYPYRLSEVELLEVEQSGMTLEDMASGMSQGDPGSMTEETETEAHSQTQSLVAEYGEASMSLSKLTGSLVYMGLQDAAKNGSDDVEIQVGTDIETYETLGQMLLVDNATTLPSWDADEGMADPYWPLVGGPVDAANMQQAQATIAPSVKAAFQGLADSGQATFTVTWWMKMGEDFTTMYMPLGFGEQASRLRLLHNTIGLSTDGLEFDHGFVLSMNNAPQCSNATDYPCMKSPNVACKGPGTGGYFGIWRHAAFRFMHGSAEDGIESELEIFMDGKSLCGIRFPADDDLIPHFMPADSYDVAFVSPLGRPDGPMLVQDARLYPRNLNSTEIRLIAQDPRFNECLDLEFNSDNLTWVSEFGQSCAELAALSSGSGNTPVACRISDVKANCPVSCIHEMRPVCHDGTPSAPSQSATLDIFSLGTRFVVASLYLEPDVASLGLDANDLPAEALQQLSTTSEWLVAGTQPNGEWYKLNEDIRLLNVGIVNPSRSGAMAINVAYETGGLFLSSVNVTDANALDLCQGARLDMEIFNSEPNTDSMDDYTLILDICEAELQGLTILNAISEGMDSGEVLAIAGLQEAAFQDDLMPSGQSFTVYYWAKSSYITDATEPRLTAYDTDRNICFAVRGTTAWLQKKGLVEDYLAYMAEGSASDGSEEAESAATDDAASSGPRERSEWSKGRMSLEIDINSLADAYTADTWIFFALSVDVEARVVRFAINSYVQEMPLDDGTWGCNYLQLLHNTGVAVTISPIRVAGFALPTGSLQRLFLSSREGYSSVSRGEKLSRFERLERTERPFKAYHGRMVSFAPPILFQRRVEASNGSSLDCNDDIVTGYNHRASIVRERKCQFPYKCTSEYRKLQCVPKRGLSPQRFFGQDGLALGDEILFPEFAWTLESETVVRDGKQLSPAEDYLDGSTVELSFYAAFYTPSSRIATIVISEFDLSGIKISSTVQYRQLAVLTPAQFRSVVLWSVTGILMCVISIILAWSAAVQEVREWLEDHKKLMQKLRLKRLNPKSAFKSTIKKRAMDKRVYSSNTTQPDLFDVVLNMAMIALLVAFLINQKTNHDQATGVFAKIADIDWGSDLSFQEKIGVFMDSMIRALDMVEMEENFLQAAFWMLCLCCVRMIIYMRIHPSISTITETFISVGRELVNFFFSFGLIFCFLAFISHVRFGYTYDEFATYKRTLITQFALLIGDSSPNYTEDSLMCVFIVAYVFVCTLSLLNFLLAIVVNGYTAVTERILENKVARSFPTDIAAVPIDSFRWMRHPHWPSKLALLIAMQARYPDVFHDEEEVLACISRNDWREIVEGASMGKATPADADELFYHYGQMEVLLILPSEVSANQRNDNRAPGDRLRDADAALGSARRDQPQPQHPLIRKISQRQH